VMLRGGPSASRASVVATPVSGTMSGGFAAVPVIGAELVAVLVAPADPSTLAALLAALLSATFQRRERQ